MELILGKLGFVPLPRNLTEGCRSFVGELAAVAGAEAVPGGEFLCRRRTGIESRLGEFLPLADREGLIVEKLLVRDGFAELTTEAAIDVL